MAKQYYTAATETSMKETTQIALCYLCRKEKNITIVELPGYQVACALHDKHAIIASDYNNDVPCPTKGCTRFGCIRIKNNVKLCNDCNIVKQS